MNFSFNFFYFYQTQCCFLLLLEEQACPLIWLNPYKRNGDRSYSHFLDHNQSTRTLRVKTIDGNQFRPLIASVRKGKDIARKSLICFLCCKSECSAFCLQFCICLHTGNFYSIQTAFYFPLSSVFFYNYSSSSHQFFAMSFFFSFCVSHKVFISGLYH